jgi:hypothetical protein
MPLPIILTGAYLATNLALMLWLERERANGRVPGHRVAAASFVLRFGPPVAGLLYLVTISGDWLFFVFVIAFFAGSFWLMDGLLAFTTPARGPDAMKSGWDDRSVRARSSTDRDRS